MNCRDLEELLSAYADGELSKTQREFIEEHLTGCADCRETLAEFETAGRQLSSLRETPVESDIRTATLSKIKATEALPDKPYRRWLRPALAITAVVAMIAAPILVRLWSADSPPGGAGIMAPPPLSEYIKGYTYTLALLAGVLMMAGLAFRSRFACKIAGFMSIVFGGIGVYLGLDALLAVTKSDQSLIMGIIPFFGLIVGTVYLKKQASRRWPTAAGLALCLAALVLYVVFLVNYHHWFSWLFLAATVALAAGVIGYAFYREISAFCKRCWRPVAATAAIVAVIAVLLATQPWGMESPEAMAASIVRNSPEVQAALNGEEIAEVEVTTRIVDDEGNVLMMLVRTEERTVAAEVNLETKKVTEIVRVDVPDFQPGDEQKAIDIAQADPRVRELMVQGGVIGRIHLGNSIDIEEVTSPDGITRKEGTVTPTALLSIKPGEEDSNKVWNIVVDLREEKLISIVQSQPSTAMIVVNISRFITRFVAPILLVLGILLVSGLSFGYRRAKTIAGISSLALGIIGLFMALYSLSSIWWRLVLSVGLPAIGLIIGITDIRQRLGKRWMPIAGIILSSLALLLVFLNAIMVNVSNVPGANIVTVIGMAAIITGIIAYAFKEKIMTLKFSGKWLRPAMVSLAAVAVLILALVQPWNVSPQSVIAKAYAATENLHSYRMFSSIKSTLEGKTLEATFETEFVAPDRHHGKATTNGDWVEFIIIGDKQYIRDSDPSRTTSVGVSSSSILSKEDTLKIIDSLTDMEKLPDEKIDGVDCIHYRGTVDVDRVIEEQKAKLNPRQPHYEEMLKGLEDMRNMKTEVELWMGKEDYLIRQVRQDMEVPLEGTSRVTVKYYDFNEPITIEPPTTASGELLPGWQLQSSPQNQQERTFGSDVSFTIGGDDLTNQQISFRITITNISDEVASNLRVSLASMATNDEDGWIWNSPSQVTLKPGESETYHISWEYDASQTSKEELDRLVGLTTILATYTTPEGKQPVELLFPDAPYPTKKPPPTPPKRQESNSNEE